jgi:hypothetical protein
MPPSEYWAVVLITAAAVIVCVAIHYEGLNLLGRLKIKDIRDRHRIIVMILCILILHIIEIWMFGLTYFWLVQDGSYGHFRDLASIGIFDSVYFSATVFSTLGFGDIVPIGAIRFVTGTQSVLGLTLIAWSASFTFVELIKVESVDDD